MRNLALFLTACLVLYINSYVPWCARSFVVATQTDHPPHSALAVVMDGEAFLKQDFEDATSFKVVLKGLHMPAPTHMQHTNTPTEHGIELPDKPRERAGVSGSAHPPTSSSQLPVALNTQKRS